MAKYIKKPVVIDAFQWTGGINQNDDPEWAADAIKNGTIYFANEGTELVQMVVETLEGDHFANPGDFIIRGVKGEIYPCKPDIFELTYKKYDDA